MSRQQPGAAPAERLSIVYRAVESLKSYDRNARHHPEKQMRYLVRSIQRFGFNCPVVISPDGTILAGHARVEAARRAGLQEVPTICAPNLSASEQRGFILADNRITELASWDRDVLALELQELADLGDFELELTGFTLNDIDIRLQEAKERTRPNVSPEDAIPRTERTSVTRRGEVWVLGPHRLLCGNATAPVDYHGLMAGAGAQVQFTDPPFNRPTRSFSGRGRTKHRDFVQGHGEFTETEYIAFLTQFLKISSDVIADGGVSFCCMDWAHLYELLSAARQVPLKLDNVVVWSKAPGMGGLYRSAHELIAVFRHGDALGINNVALGATGRNRSNVWHYPSAPNFKRRRELATHPTPKPVELVADALRDVSVPGSVVLDPFMGSGTTLIAAEKTGRIAYGMELDPLYCDVVVRRWQRYAGRAAIREGCNTPFDIIEIERARKLREAGGDDRKTVGTEL